MSRLSLRQARGVLGSKFKLHSPTLCVGQSHVGTSGDNVVRGSLLSPLPTQMPVLSLLTNLSSLEVDTTTMKDTQGEADHGIKCKYMLAARGYLSNTTFHGIPWVLEDISKGAKVKH